MLIIDRFEGEYALIKMKRKVFHIPKVLLFKGAKKGDVINMQITFDQEATADLKKEAQNMTDDL